MFVLKDRDENWFRSLEARGNVSCFYMVSGMHHLRWLVIFHWFRGRYDNSEIKGAWRKKKKKRKRGKEKMREKSKKQKKNEWEANETAAKCTCPTWNYTAPRQYIFDFDMLTDGFNKSDFKVKNMPFPFIFSKWSTTVPGPVNNYGTISVHNYNFEVCFFIIA